MAGLGAQETRRRRRLWLPTDLSDEQILEKLLALNLDHAAEEAKSAKVKKTKAQRAKETDELI